MLVRLLRHLYPKVTYVSNITDIDDKIIKASQENNVPIKEITAKYEKIYNEDMSSLGVLPPDIQPHATEYIEEMIELIKKNIKNGTAYVSNEHVLFNVKSYSSYGALSGRNIDDQHGGSRVEVADYKINPGDFILWKPSTDDQPGWESPWGFGRPGWHLECSTMSEETLGLPFDIHGGGMDLIFPHHENEIAQSCAAHHIDNPKKYSKYWLHNALLNMDGEKMSKSLGNIIYIRDLINKYNGEVLRLALLSGHYRQSLSWNDKTIHQAQTNLDRIYRVLKKTDDIQIDSELLSDIPEQIVSALCDDLNTSKVIAQINDFAKKLSKSTNDKEKKELKIKLLSSGKIMGILNNSPDSWLGIGSVKDESNKDLIKELIDLRNMARAEKNFVKADEIRDKLKKMEIEIEDTPNGTIWKSIK